jgi:dihydroneopterin aldolase
MTTKQALKKLAAHGKKVTLQQLYRYFIACDIKPSGANQRPQQYPADSVQRILQHLGYSNEVVETRAKQRRTSKFSIGKISIVDLEVFYRVGVPAAERAQPQRLLLTVELETDFSAAAKSDAIADTIDYFAVTQRLLNFGGGREWKLIEKLAADLADAVLAEFKPQSVSVEVKKFIIPQARHVAVSLTRTR